MAGTIVVGYNGTSHSEGAVDWAVEEAARRNAEIVVVSAADYTGMGVGTAPGLVELGSYAIDAAERVTAAGVERARVGYDNVPDSPNKWPVDVSGSTQMGSGAGTLIEASRAADLLVVGTRGRGLVAGTLLGSVAFSVAAHAHCPVVVVHEDNDVQAEARQRVVVAVDGSDPAAAATRLAGEFASLRSVPLEVISAFEAPLKNGHEERGQPKDDSTTLAHQRAEQICSAAESAVRAEHPELEVSTRMVPGGAEDAITQASEGAGLVVIGSRGRGGFAGLVLGSVSRSVIYGASCPVAVAHADGD
ncbi:MAG TPA: universal stress protein [Jiangellaceae bacterium]|nr:universal stress protein [Jiangellaceae bacterium]